MKPEQIASAFSRSRDIISCEVWGNGHINDTYRVTAPDEHYILQRINQQVFTKPQQVMENVLGITGWIRRKLEAEGEDTARKVLHVRSTEDGKAWLVDDRGEYWRAYDFIEDAVCYERPETDGIFCESAAAFGKFQRMLADYPVETLWETIPDFHNTPVRFVQFQQAVAADPAGRLSLARAEADFLLDHEPLAKRLTDAALRGDLPVRVTHNDTKLNNVMIDKQSGKGLCVLDLDTVMPGFSVTDFGDAIRFGASTAAEDEPDPGKVHFDLRLYELYMRSYIEGCGGALTETELMMLPDGALVITFEQALRFLADYLNGDIYYKTARPQHNLDRARTQIRLLAEMEEQIDVMRDSIRQHLGRKMLI